jgi:hypothetical protein
MVMIMNDSSAPPPSPAKAVLLVSPEAALVAAPPPLYGAVAPVLLEARSLSADQRIHRGQPN